MEETAFPEDANSSWARSVARGAAAASREGSELNIHQPRGDVPGRTLAIVEELKGLEGPLLPILHEIQDEFGYVPQDRLPVIARELNLSRAEVLWRR